MSRSRYGPFQSDRCGEGPPALLLEAIAQFNRGEYFAQHETLETLWRTEPGDIRYLYQGILLVGVGLFHLVERGNFHGAVAKLDTGVRLLQWFRPVCQGVDVDGLIADALRTRAALLALGPNRLSEFDRSLTPTVRLVPDQPGAGSQGCLRKHWTDDQPGPSTRGPSPDPGSIPAGEG